jgi:hypothetical protein
MNLLPKRALTLSGTIMLAVVVGLLCVKYVPGDGLFLVLGVMAVLLAGALIVLPRLDKSYNFSPWVKFTLRIAIAATILWGTGVFLTQQFPFEVLASQVKGYLVDMIFAILSGFVIGIFTALFLSGGLAKKPKDPIKMETESSH